MPPWKPVKRRELIAGLRRAGFTGPYSGGRHEFMQRGDLVLTIPNPHGSDISLGLLKAILRQAGISKAEWEKV
jgi:predicted RNA binding protein YcfA (HicA-like mRNA interferase family)